MKRFTAAVIISCIIVSCFNLAFVSASEVVSIPTLIYEDFDAYQTGSQNSKGGMVVKSNVLEIAEYPSASDKSLMFKGESETDSYLEYNTSELADEYILELDFIRKVSGNGMFKVYFRSTSGKNTELFTVNEANTVTCGTSTLFSLENNVNYKFTIVYSQKEGAFDFYVNHKKRASSVKTTAGAALEYLRFHMTGISGTENMPLFYMNNLIIYEYDTPTFLLDEMNINYILDKQNNITADSIPNISDYVDYMANTAVLFDNSNRIIVNGKTKMLNQANEDICVIREDGVSYIPIDSFCDAVGVYFDYNFQKRTAQISFKGKTTVLECGEGYMTLDNADGKVSANLVIDDNHMIQKDDSFYVKAETVEMIFNKKLTYDRGLLIFADRENFFNLINDTGAYWYTVSELYCEEVDGAQMAEDVKANYPGQMHPRIHGNNEKFEKIKKAISTYPDFKVLYDNMIEIADSYVKSPLLSFSGAEGERIAGTAHKNRFETLGLAYRLTGDAKYAQRCWEELENTCNYVHWGPRDYIDCATVMLGVATGYDWIYDYLNETQRKVIKDAILEKGFVTVLEDLDDVPGRDRATNWAQAQTPNNWNQVCCGSAITAALVFCDDADLGKKAEEVLTKSMKLLRKSPPMYGPDGAWFEGTDYWQYSMRYLAIVLSAMQSSCGDMYGYNNAPGFEKTGYFLYGMQGSAGTTFNFHDSTEAKPNATETFFLATLYDDAALASLRWNGIKSGEQSADVYDLLYLDTDMIPNLVDEVNVNRDFYYRGTEVAMVRTDWNNYNSVSVGLHAGAIGVTHGQYDAGQFILDGYGERYFIDLGKDDYYMSGSLYTKYRYRAEGHNLLYINPGDKMDQNKRGVSVIDRFDTNNSSAIMVTNLDDVYKYDAQSVVRGIKFTDNRKSVIIQDEISVENESEIWWFAHTRMDVDIVEDGKAAIVHGDYRDLYVKLISDIDAKFTVMDAKPLENSPQNPGNNPNLGVRKLALCHNSKGRSTVSVYCTFLLKGEYDGNVKTPSVVPISQWKLDEDTQSASTPTLSSIKIDGTTVEDFSKYKTGYTIYCNSDASHPVITAEGDGQISYSIPDTIPGNAIISVSENGQETHYTLAFKNVETAASKLGYTKLKVEKASSDFVPQPENSPENSIDGNPDTRWSAEGECDIVYDLGTSRNISAVGIAVWQGANTDGRKQNFEVLVSGDGATYTSVYSGNSSGTTLDEEIFEFDMVNARYIKLLCKGTSSGKWNSILEFNAYIK